MSFLALAAAPSLLLSWIATERIRDALDRVRIPGLEESLATSAVIGAELIDRLNREADIVVTEMGGAAALEDADAIRRDVLESRRFDFLAWRGGTVDTRASLEEEAAAQEGSPQGAPLGGPEAAAAKGVPTPEEWAILDEGEMPPLLRDGALRFFRSLPSGEGYVALGVRVSDDVARALSANDEALGRYLQLGYFVEIQKKIVWVSWAAIFLLTAAGAYVAARITARRIARPVRELAGAADRLAAGDLSHRAAVRADGEIGDLVSAFNRMAGEIERSRANLLRAERIAAWRDVARRIAHEIRNPLTPVKVAVHRLRGRLADDAAAQESLRSIGEEVDNLTRIAETFAEFAKLPEPKFERVDLAAIARSVVELVRSSAEADGVTVTCEGDAEVVVRADADQMRRAITNLVKNAVEATVEGRKGGEGGEGAGGGGGGGGGAGGGRSGKGGGRVVVRVTSRGGAGDAATGRRARIEVIDDGPGVPEEMREAIFRPGFTTKERGSGLGLALVHRIARDHDGELRLGGEAKGAGEPGGAARAAGGRRGGDAAGGTSTDEPRGGYFILEVPGLEPAPEGEV